MTPIQHKSNNDVLKAPPGMSSEECQPLPITRVNYKTPSIENPIPAVISFWQPSQEQIELINAGYPIYLHFIGITHPPVAVGVEGDGRI